MSLSFSLCAFVPDNFVPILLPLCLFFSLCAFVPYNFVPTLLGIHRGLPLLCAFVPSSPLPLCLFIILISTPCFKERDDSHDKENDHTDEASVAGVVCDNEGHDEAEYCEIKRRSFQRIFLPGFFYG